MLWSIKRKTNQVLIFTTIAVALGSPLMFRFMLFSVLWQVRRSSAFVGLEWEVVIIFLYNLLASFQPPWCVIFYMFFWCLVYFGLCIFVSRFLMCLDKNRLDSLCLKVIEIFSCILFLPLMSSQIMNFTLLS